MSDNNSQFGFSFNQVRCTGCKTCEMACRDYHDISEGSAFRTVHEYTGGTWQQNADGTWEQDVFSFYISMSCNHCSNPICIRFCSADAITKDSLGFVVVSDKDCVGCQSCMVACPYHAPRFSEESAHVAKCDGCRDRIEAGMSPICVEACPQRALDYGIYASLSEQVTMVEKVASMPDPNITQPNYAIKPSFASQYARDSSSSPINLSELG